MPAERGAAEHDGELAHHGHHHRRAGYADHAERRGVATAGRQLDGGADEQPGQGHQQHQRGDDAVEPQREGVRALVEDVPLLGEGGPDA